MEATKTKPVEKHVSGHCSDKTHAWHTNRRSLFASCQFGLELISNYRIIDLRNQVQIEAEFSRPLLIDLAAAG